MFKAKRKNSAEKVTMTQEKNEVLGNLGRHRDRSVVPGNLGRYGLNCSSQV